MICIHRTSVHLRTHEGSVQVQRYDSNQAVKSKQEDRTDDEIDNGIDKLSERVAWL